MLLSITRVHTYSTVLYCRSVYKHWLPKPLQCWHSNQSHTPITLTLMVRYISFMSESYWIKCFENYMKLYMHKFSLQVPVKQEMCNSFCDFQRCFRTYSRHTNWYIYTVTQTLPKEMCRMRISFLLYFSIPPELYY